MAHLPSGDPPDSHGAQSGRADGPALDPKNDDAGQPLRILVVDDLVDAADGLAIYLARHGHAVRTAHDGHAALATAIAFTPHVILLDIGLPRLDGYRVAEQIRQHLPLQKVCLIAVTGFGQHDDRQAAHFAGFDHFLLKPVDGSRLIALLSGLGQ